ncbi:MAG: RluA family pseudouridine synthase [Bdellovibrionales bacterium]|nr:RluA family pseudouridine synthase [Bdellovibrionales bacterium]
MNDKLPPPLPGEEFREHKFIVEASQAGNRIDRMLAAIPEIGTRSQASRLLSRGLVFVDGQPVKPSLVTKAGDEICVYVPFIPKLTLVPYELPLDIAYEDDDLIVVDKPAGLVVHPAYGHAQDTLVNALLHHTKDLSQGFDEMRPGLVHRLDKDTSGLIVIAKNEKAQRELALQFQRKISHRIYRAVVFGNLKPDAGTITSYLKRHPDDRRRSASVEAGVENAKLAITHYRTLATHPTGLSLVELKLETGRTHQIRVHMKEAGHPIVGDLTYGADGRAKSLKSVQLRKQIGEMSRFALHAFELGFYHPNKGGFIKLKSKWPEDLLPLIQHCDFPMFENSSGVEKFSQRPDDDYPWPKVRTHDDV